MEPPLQPNTSDCCNSGCNPCILDIYEQQLREYQEFIKNPQIRNITNRINCIDRIVYKKFKLIDKQQHTNNTYFYRFQYIDDDIIVEQKSNGLYYEWGQYFLLKAPKESNEFTRAYTPIPYNNDNLNSFTILIRLYIDGEMSNYLKRLELNDVTLWRGPYGNFQLNPLQNQIFIAQGTGIAPIYAIIKRLLNDPTYVKRIKLVFCCCNCDEILLRDELIEFNRFWNCECEIFIGNNEHFVENYYETIHKHKLDVNDLKRLLDGGSIDDVQVNVCGSETFEKAIKQWIEDCSVDVHNIYLF